MALAGIAATAVLPLLVYRWARSPGSPSPSLGARWAALYCALLAISPSLIYYSRIARPYGVVTLLAPLAAVLYGATLVAAGPYAAQPALRLGPFAGHPRSIDFPTPAMRTPRDRVPAVYSLIAREPGDGAVLEITAGSAGMFQVPALAFWRVHRRPVIVTSDNEVAADRRLRLRTLTGLDPAPMEASGARFVLLHLDLPRFQSLDRDGPGSPDAKRSTPPHHPGLVTARRLGSELVAARGEPDLVDGSEWVWNLACVRARGRPSGGQPEGSGRGGATKRTAPGNTS